MGQYVQTSEDCAGTQPSGRVMHSCVKRHCSSFVFSMTDSGCAPSPIHFVLWPVGWHYAGAFCQTRRRPFVAVCWWFKSVKSSLSPAYIDLWQLQVNLPDAMTSSSHSCVTVSVVTACLHVLWLKVNTSVSLLCANSEYLVPSSAWYDDVA